MSNKNNWYVYKHTTPSGKIYIGISHYKDPETRWKNGRGYKHNPHFTNAILKYGWDNIIHDILIEHLTHEEAKLKEIEYIAKYKSLGVCYNITDGGDGHNGEQISKLTREKISNSLKELHLQPWNKGKTGIYSEETRYRMGAGTRGKPGVNLGRKMPPVSEETRKKISLANKGKTGWSKGKKLKPVSEETRKKISENLKGKRLGIPLGPRPEDVKEKISKGRIGQKWVCKPWVQPKQIPQDEVEQYVNDGWNLGKIIKHNGKFYKWLSKESKWIEYLPATKF